MDKEDYYDVLGVGRNADERELKRAYRRLAMKHHPDRNQDDPEGADIRFRVVAEAYQVLTDPHKRALYDAFGHEGLAAGGPVDDFDDADDIFSQFGDIFGDIFSDFGGGRERPDRGPRRGEDLRYDLDLSFEEAVFGSQRIVELERYTPCEECEGVGAASGTSPRPCPTCKGTGQISHSQGFFTLTSACPECKGTGEIIPDACPACEGEGAHIDRREVNVRIPAGVDDGTRLRLRGEGEAGPRGGQRGDLYVVLHVQPSQTFTRDGADLHLRAQISFVQAAIGCSLEIPTLGDPTTVHVAGGAQYGDTIVLPHEGVHRVNRDGRGDLVVHLVVQTPRELTDRQRELLLAFAAEADLDLDAVHLQDPAQYHDPLGPFADEEADVEEVKSSVS